MEATMTQADTKESKPIDCVGVICFRGEDVLLIQRGTAPRKGEWSIPERLMQNLRIIITGCMIMRRGGFQASLNLVMMPLMLALFRFKIWMA